MFQQRLTRSSYRCAPQDSLAKQRCRCRPMVEELEERTLLSADAVLDWNAIMLEANRIDHTPGDPAPGAGALTQGGPTRTSRAFAIVAAAMYDALNSITGHFTPYLVSISGFANADQRAAIAQAAHDTLTALYPLQQPTFDADLTAYLAGIPDGTAENQGITLGHQVAQAILAARANDGSDATMSFTPVPGPGKHQ